MIALNEMIYKAAFDNDLEKVRELLQKKENLEANKNSNTKKARKWLNISFI